jgi:CBS domain-containing protein
VKVSDVMTRSPVTVSADSTLAEAANLMIKTRVSGLPVVDVKGAVIGMITQGDLLRRVELGTAGRGPGWLSSFFAPGRAAHDYVRTHGHSVGEIMTSEVISTCADAPLSAVVALLESQQIKRLPVLQKGHLIGIVSRADLLRALAQLLPQRRVIAISDVYPIGHRHRDAEGVIAPSSARPRRPPGSRFNSSSCATEGKSYCMRAACRRSFRLTRS